MTVDSATPQANASARASTATSASRGMSIGGNRTNSATPIAANPTPTAAPSDARSRLSVSSCLTRRDRLAPIAARSATSRSRTVARASRRFATLMQATRSSRPTAPSSAMSATRKNPATSCESGTAKTVQPLLVAENSDCSRVPSAASSVLAASIVTPGFSRAMVSMKCAARECCAKSQLRRWYTSTPAGKLKPGGPTPTTVCRSPFNCTDRPMMSRSAA